MKFDLRNGSENCALLKTLSLRTAPDTAKAVNSERDKTRVEGDGLD